ncbi:MAG: InlB B-repeat-containing protein [Methanocorpusculum sp.]|nr:InlB B-repeat-containing protein [Methanocorpusculum sp.]
MSLRRYGADCPNDAAKLMRRGVLALAVLLLACVLMAGAVSAEESSADVSSYAELIQNLSEKKTVINLTTDIAATAPILVNYSVTINGQWHTITADNSSGGFPKTGHGNGCDRHLLCTGKGIAEDKAKVNLTNITFENYNSNGGAWGIQFTNESKTVNTGKYHMITLENVVINGSQGSGITLKSENMTAVNLTIQNSSWGQSIDVEAAADGVNPTWLKVDDQTYTRGLKDLTMISNEGTAKATVYRGDSLQDATHSWFRPDKEAIYGQQRIVWATAEDYATKVESGIFNASVRNSTDSIIDLHTDLSKALSSTYAASGATVTLLKDITLETLLTFDAETITFDGAGKSLILNTGKGTTAITANKNTLKNLTVTAKQDATFGTAINLGESGQLLNSNIDLSNLKSASSSDTGRMSSIAVYLSGKDAVVKGNTITAGNSATSSSQCIVVGATNATIADNRLTTGTAKADPRTDTGHVGETSSGSVAIRISAASVKAEITNNTITSNKGESDTTRNVAFAVDGSSVSGAQVNATNNTITLASHLIQKDLGGYGVVLYLNTGNSAEVTANLHSNKVTGSTYVIYADNSSGGSSTTVKGEIFNNNFGSITTAVDNHSAVTLTATALKWNITPASLGSYKAVVTDQTSVAGNYWEWSEGKKSTTGYMTFADAAAATAAGLPVADLHPLVAIGQPVQQTIEIKGNLSIENKTGKSETLTAVFTGGVSADFTWTLGTDGIISLGATTGSSVTYTPIKIGTTNLTVTSDTVSKVVIITVYNTTVPNVDTTVKKEGDKVNLSTTSSSTSTTSIETSPDNKTATLKTTSGVNITLTYADAGGADVETDSSGNVISVNGTINAMVAVYPKSEAPVSVDMPVPATYALNITLDASKALENGAAIVLPIIDPAINQTVVETITQKNSNHKPLAMITASVSSGTIEQINSNISSNGIELKIIIPKEGKASLGKVKALHIEGNNIKEVTIRVQSTSTEWVITIYGSGFSSYVLVEDTTPSGGGGGGSTTTTSGDGNMDGSYRVLFNDGSSTLSVRTGLSAGDKITAPPAPTKDGYTFGGWYKDSACTQGWSFSEGIPGDMTLYAKWTPSSGGQSSSSQQTVSQTGSATAQQTVKATPAATQAQSTSAATPAASGTSASGSTSPAMTQAPAPVLGALLGLLAAGVLIRRRD